MNLNQIACQIFLPLNLCFSLPCAQFPMVCRTQLKTDVTFAYTPGLPARAQPVNINSTWKREAWGLGKISIATHYLPPKRQFLLTLSWFLSDK